MMNVALGAPSSSILFPLASSRTDYSGAASHAQATPPAEKWRAADFLFLAIFHFVTKFSSNFLVVVWTQAAKTLPFKVEIKIHLT